MTQGCKYAQLDWQEIVYDWKKSGVKANTYYKELFVKHLKDLYPLLTTVPTFETFKKYCSIQTLSKEKLEKWSPIYEDFLLSGLSIAEYARQYEYNHATLRRTFVELKENEINLTKTNSDELVQIIDFPSSAISRLSNLENRIANPLNKTTADKSLKNLLSITVNGILINFNTPSPERSVALIAKYLSGAL